MAVPRSVRRRVRPDDAVSHAERSGAASRFGFYLIFRVYRENTFTSATIELAPDQKVISTGPYALVRHAASLPGYREYQTQVIHRLIPGIW